MAEKYYADLNHLTSDEVEAFYQRYLNEKPVIWSKVTT